MKNFFIVFGSAFLIISGASDISARSQGASSWEYETSFAALTIRSIGGLKVGLGLVALSALNISASAITSSISSELKEVNTKVKTLVETNSLKITKNSNEDEIWETLMYLLSEKNCALADKSKSKYSPSDTDPRYSICKSNSMEIAIGTVKDPYAEKWEWRVVEF